jgi:predicted branched-subunit amino acid permease
MTRSIPSGTPISTPISTPIGTAGRAETVPRREMARGARAMLPLTVGYLPFGLLLGAAVSAGANPAASWTGTLLIYGGSAHLTVLELLRSGSSLVAVIGAALLINVRLLVYSSALAPLWRSARWPVKLLAAATVIDPTWMLAERRAAEPGSVAERRAHYAGAAICLTLGWVIWVTAGAVLGAVAQSAAPLAVAIPLCLTAIVAPHLHAAGGVAAIAAACGTALATSTWPAGYGIPVAMAAAAAAGGLWTRGSGKRLGSGRRS